MTKWVGMTCGAPPAGSLTASWPKSCPASQSRHSVSLMAASQGWISMWVFSCWRGLSCGDEPTGDGGLRAQPDEGAGEVVPRRGQAVEPQCGESVDDEDGVRGGGCYPGAGALPP